MDSRMMIRTVLALTLILVTSYGKSVEKHEIETTIVEETQSGEKTYADLDEYYAAQYADLGRTSWQDYVPKPVRDQLWPKEDADSAENEVDWRRYVPGPFKRDRLEEAEDESDEEDQEDPYKMESPKKEEREREDGKQQKEKVKDKDKQKVKDKDKEKNKGQQQREKEKEREEKKDKDERKREREKEKEERRREKEREKEERQREKEERKREKEREKEERRRQREKDREERKKDREERRKEREERQKVRQEKCDEKLPGSMALWNWHPCRVVCMKVEEFWKREIKIYPYREGETCFQNRVCQNGRCVTPKPTTPEVSTTEATTVSDDDASYETTVAPTDDSGESGTTEDGGVTQTERIVTTDDGTSYETTAAPTDDSGESGTTEESAGTQTERVATTDASAEADVTTDADSGEVVATTDGSREEDATTDIDTKDTTDSEVTDDTNDDSQNEEDNLFKIAAAAGVPPGRTVQPTDHVKERRVTAEPLPPKRIWLPNRPTVETLHKPLPPKFIRQPDSQETPHSEPPSLPEDRPSKPLPPRQIRLPHTEDHSSAPEDRITKPLPPKRIRLPDNPATSEKPYERELTSRSLLEEHSEAEIERRSSHQDELLRGTTIPSQPKLIFPSARPAALQTPEDLEGWHLHGPAGGEGDEEHRHRPSVKPQLPRTFWHATTLPSKPTQTTITSES